MKVVFPSSAVSDVVEKLVVFGARIATKYLTEDLVVTATIKRVKGRLPSNKARTLEIPLKIGRPNYRERQFIKLCKKAGEPFPVKKIQLVIPRG